MPRMMNPPHYQGVFYDGAYVQPGAHVKVHDVDVDALLSEGWILLPGDFDAAPVVTQPKTDEEGDKP